MKKKQKRYYISAKGYRKADYKKALATKYNIIFTDSLSDADFFLAPYDYSGLSQEQKHELEEARLYGKETMLIEEKFLHDSSDPLELHTKECIKEDLSEELEL